jgi:hypothetical protein
MYATVALRNLHTLAPIHFAVDLNTKSTEIATHMPTLNNLTQTTTRNISPAIHYIVGKTVYSSSSSSELSLECIKKVIYLNYTVKAFERGLAKRVNLLVTLSP